MKKRNNKVCLGCRAYQEKKCILGYKIQLIEEYYSSIIKHKPLEPCSKPTTHKALQKELKKHKTS